jgi:hypothetical protein
VEEKDKKIKYNIINIKKKKKKTRTNNLRSKGKKTERNLKIKKNKNEKGPDQRRNHLIPLSLFLSQVRPRSDSFTCDDRGS